MSSPDTRIRSPMLRTKQAHGCGNSYSVITKWAIPMTTTLSFERGFRWYRRKWPLYPVFHTSEQASLARQAQCNLAQPRSACRTTRAPRKLTRVLPSDVTAGASRRLSNLGIRAMRVILPPTSILTRGCFDKETDLPSNDLCLTRGCLTKEIDLPCHSPCSGMS